MKTGDIDKPTTAETVTLSSAAADAHGEISPILRQTTRDTTLIVGESISAPAMSTPSWTDPLDASKSETSRAIEKLLCAARRQSLGLMTRTLHEHDDQARWDEMHFGLFSNGIRRHTSAARSYDEDIAEIVLADELGFRDAYISEHHGEPAMSEPSTRFPHLNC